MKCPKKDSPCFVQGESFFILDCEKEKYIE